MKRKILLFPLLIALIFPILFLKKQAGLNILILDFLLFSLLAYSGRPNFKNRLTWIAIAGIVLSGFMVLMHGSDIALAVNIVSLIVLSGILAAPTLNVLLNGFVVSFFSVFVAPVNYFSDLFRAPGTNNGIRKGFKYAAFLLIPLLVLLIFISIYSNASPYFNSLTGGFLRSLNDFLNWFFKLVSPEVFAIGVGGFFVGLILFFGKLPSIFDLPGESGSNVLMRSRKWYRGSVVGLKTEARMAKLLFILLNIALAIMNILDLWHVWINFEWNGGFLKQFVHEGTWLLIFSILISIALVLWYLRGNLNFYSNNHWLIKLMKLWLIQNAFLALSVAVRNFWYTHYFNLAYKRIWVFAFLILVLVGLATVFIKVQNNKSLRYLLIQNSLYAYIILVIMSFFNWDLIIARFNLNRSEKAFYHTDFMVGLDSNTLPLLIIDENRIQRISTAQKSIFHYYDNYLPLEQYNTRLLERRKLYLEGYPDLNWLEWNVTDYITYKRLRNISHTP